MQQDRGARCLAPPPARQSSSGGGARATGYSCNAEAMRGRLRRHSKILADRKAVLSSRPVPASNCFPPRRKTLSILLASVALAAELLGANQAAPVSAQSPPQFEALPLVRSRQNHLLVRAYINGKPAWLGVDSGAPVSAIALHRGDYFQVNGIAGNPALPSHVEINGAFNKVGIVRKIRL